MRIIISAIIAAALASTSLSVLAKNPHGKGLPPGLQKKVNRGGELPPGWQKKLARGHVIDVRVYNAGKIIVPPDPRGILTLKVENRLLRVHKDTLKILKIIR